MSPLTLPGTIPGLLRRGSPVILATRTYGGSVFLDAARGVVCSEGGRVATETLGGSPVLVSTGAGDLALDLSGPTGRAHAAWWLADQDGDVLAEAWDLVLGEPDADPLHRINLWASGEDLDEARIRSLRLVCLHVAGLAP
jgi:hypothetical protein